jgi:hypothetical protein
MTTTVDAGEFVDLSPAALAAGYGVTVLCAPDAVPAVVGPTGPGLADVLAALGAHGVAVAPTVGVLTPHGDDLTVTQHTDGTAVTVTVSLTPQTDPGGW